LKKGIVLKISFKQIHKKTLEIKKKYLDGKLTALTFALPIKKGAFSKEKDSKKS